jgi:histidine ammonia-lyase
VAALTCEAVQAYTEPFDSSHFDLSRPLKGVMQSASQLRALLEGSRSANESKRSVQDAEAIAAIPQIHGPAREAIEVYILFLFAWIAMKTCSFNCNFLACCRAFLAR